MGVAARGPAGAHQQPYDRQHPDLDLAFIQKAVVLVADTATRDGGKRGRYDIVAAAPRLQLLTIADLLDGKRVEYPGESTTTTYKRVARASARGPGAAAALMEEDGHLGRWPATRENPGLAVHCGQEDRDPAQLRHEWEAVSVRRRKEGGHGL
jgi:hypothetical protein